MSSLELTIEYVFDLRKSSRGTKADRKIFVGVGGGGGEGHMYYE